ncbi:hypothetical protein M441DRAFT_68465 [Trichoderma asperellum CBS 433.97]|uniref:Uncharacterized protein n=1 Tax=Trichoderma asperellum (strain ATCC 204424 / CBS 433.97 / NBRC 101777) TaxID=1042311 RepID=A0A2T3Z9E7_TRIA4|nr:hypothetical protein M441DRAFT_68465 [Trichoderma asperellum CBS 433.97]PTB41441.1 hypothetical protein M441DRAFT_68465 [Trichoderma asperellum CBS 433.97]
MPIRLWLALIDILGHFISLASSCANFSSRIPPLPHCQIERGMCSIFAAPVKAFQR